MFFERVYWLEGIPVGEYTISSINYLAFFIRVTFNAFSFTTGPPKESHHHFYTIILAQFQFNYIANIQLMQARVARPLMALRQSKLGSDHARLD